VALTGDDINQITGMLEVLEARLGVGKLCTPTNPHDTMTYQRGPNLYHCRCSQTYEKDGRGGLREVG